MKRWQSRLLLFPFIAGPPLACGGAAEADLFTPTSSVASQEATDQLACPGPGPERGPRTAPVEAVEACADLTADAECRFALEDYVITGTCRADPRGEQPLVCAPLGGPSGCGCPPGPPPGAPPAPPPEAIAACADLEIDASCSFTLDGNTLTGTCRAGPSADLPLACAPLGAPPPGPPEAAIAACGGASAGSDCGFAVANGTTLSGTCQPGPTAELPLACAPLGPPSGVSPGPPAAAIAACVDVAVGASCSFALDANVLTGTCRGGPNGELPLACVPVGGAGPQGCPHGGSGREPGGAPPPPEG